MLPPFNVIEASSGLCPGHLPLVLALAAGVIIVIFKS